MLRRLTPRSPLFIAAALLQGCAASAASTPTWPAPRPVPALERSAPRPVAPPAAPVVTPEPEEEEPAVEAPEAPEPGPCPVEMALLDDSVCVDRWEASLEELQEDGSATPWSPFRSPREAKRPLRAVSRAGVVPQGYVSGVQAEAACERAGKRLCSSDEWIAACRGPQWTRYPYGDVRQRGKCNDAGRAKHPVAEVHQRLGLPLDRMWYEGMEHPLINQLDDTLRKTGELSECTNEVGTFDMVGNLHEWVDDSEGTFRGGFYMDTQINGEGCDYATTAHAKTYADYSTGFRCCVEAKGED